MYRFIIIGAQKAGSTFIQQSIGEHPEVYTPDEESPTFEDPDYTPERAQRYRDKLAAVAGDRVMGIKRPNYLGQPEVPPRAALHAPEARLIAVLRDPRERLLSAYYHMMRGGFLPVVEPEAGIRQALAGEWDKSYPAAKQLVDFGMYGKHLQDWLQHYDREALLVQFFEDIRSRGPDLVGEAYRHIGVDEGFRSEAKRQPMPGMYSLKRQRINAVMRPLSWEWFHGGLRIRARKGIVPKTLHKLSRTADRVVWSRLFPARSPKLSTELREQLTEIFHDDVCQLEAMTSRDLSAWRTL